MRRNPILASVGAVFAIAVQVCAGPLSCYSSKSESLLDRFLDAEILVVAHMRNAVGPDNLHVNGRTELWFDEFLKPHKATKGQKSMMMPRYVPSKKKFLVAMEIYKGELDAYQGTELDADGAILKYVRGGLQLKDKSTLARLRYNVDFVTDACEEVAKSAQIEIDRAAYGELRKVAAKLDRAPLVKALTTRQHSPEQHGTLALLLGHCGKKEDAMIVRKLLDAADPKADISGLLFVHVLLDTDAGWAYIAKTLATDNDDLRRRYLTFKTVRRINDERPGLISRKRRDDAMLSILKMPDMADFAIEFLARNQWDHAEAIFDLAGKKPYDTALMRRTILRYALQCPTPRAKNHVNEQLGRDPEWVADVAELLKLEEPPKKPGQQ